MKLMKGKPIKNLGKPSDIHQALFVCVQTYLVTKKEGFSTHVLYLTKYIAYIGRYTLRTPSLSNYALLTSLWANFNISQY